MKLLAPFALIVAALAVVIYVDDTATDADLIFVNQNEVFTLDPQRMSYLQDLRLAHVLYEGLVRWDNDDFSILPAAAAELPEIRDSARTYTFRIRPEATWSNGQPVTAHDFIYAWKRALLPDTAADYSNMFFVIDGAEEFFTWRTQQTNGYTANPWDMDPPDGETTRACVARLRGLLDASDLPPALAALMPGASARPALRAELDRLEAAAGVGGSTLEADLAEAATSRELVSRLEDADDDETRWMWRRAEKHFRDTVGLRALGPRTLEVRLRRPTAYFRDLLCFGVFFPVHRPTVEGWPKDATPAGGWHETEPPPFDQRRWVTLNAETGKFEQRHGWARPDHHVGNGTHRLAQWRYKRDLRLERNEAYHDQDRIRSDSILALTIEDTNTAVLAFESGRVDWLADVSAEYESDMIAQLERYMERFRDEIAAAVEADQPLDETLGVLPPPRADERRNIHVFPTFGTDFYSFNCREELSNGDPNPFASAKVRRAFVMAVDRQTIVDRVTRLHEPVITTLIPPGSIPGYVSPEGLGEDLDRAKATLAEAGWQDRDADGLVEQWIDHDGDAAIDDDELERFPVIDLLYTTNVPRYKWISLNLKSQWEQKLGVRVELRPEETKFYRNDLKKGQFMIARGRWYGDYGDPTTFLDLCKTTDGNNDRKYSRKEVDDLLEAASNEPDEQKRLAMLSECERLLFGAEEGDVPMLVLCQLVQVYMYEPGRVSGLSAHPRLTQFLWQMKVEDR